MKLKQFGMIVVMLLLTVAIGGFGCSSSSSDDGATDTGNEGGDGNEGGEGEGEGEDITAIAPKDFSASTGRLSINAEGAIERIVDPYSFRLTGDAELPAGANADDVTYAWTTVDGAVVIATPNDQSTEVTVPATVTGAVEFKLTVTYKEKSSEATTTVTLNEPTSGILYVNADDEDDGADGSSWGSALSGNGDTMSLQTVIDAAGRAVLGGEFDSIKIWVKAGTYLPTWNWGEGDAKKSSFRLRNGVSVIGGFAGDESSKSAREKSGVAGRIYASETILSGDLDKDDNSVLEFRCETYPLPTTNKIDCDEEGAYIREIKEPSSYENNVFHVLYHNDEAVDETARLDGVVIRGGNALPAANFKSGGGIFNAGSVSPTIISTIVENNRARRGG
ncbi:MAG: PKD domain-containing protein, partial [Nitrospinota bacterium]